jgi:hypothetical protein
MPLILLMNFWQRAPEHRKFCPAGGRICRVSGARWGA